MCVYLTYCAVWVEVKTLFKRFNQMENVVGVLVRKGCGETGAATAKQVTHPLLRDTSAGLEAQSCRRIKLEHVPQSRDRELLLFAVDS